MSHFDRVLFLASKLKESEYCFRFLFKAAIWTSPSIRHHWDS